MINFPLYALRAYVRRFDEGGYSIIETAKSRYVIDFATYPEDSTYLDRRLELIKLADTLPYSIYPLSKRVDRISHVLKAKAKKFIDAKGKIITWKPTTFYPTVCVPIKSSWQLKDGTYCITLKGLSTKFIVSNNNYKYAQVVQAGRRNILYDLCNEFRPMTRKKL